MKDTIAVLLSAVLILSVSTPLLAKENTVKITISGAGLKAPIEISDPKILTNFSVWTGPGTSTADQQGFIIDWSHGPVREPPNTSHVPGESDELFSRNVGSIFRGVEGKWFRAWGAWERVARPLLEKAELSDSIQPRNFG